MSRQHFFVKPKFQMRYLLRTLVTVVITVVILYIFLMNELTSSLKAVVDNAYIEQIVWVSSKTFIVVALILVIAFCMHALFSSHSLAGAMYAIERTIKNLSEGNFKAVVETRRDDELKETVVQLQQMVGKIRNIVDEDRRKIIEIKKLVAGLREDSTEKNKAAIEEIESKISMLTSKFKI